MSVDMRARLDELRAMAVRLVEEIDRLKKQVERNERPQETGSTTPPRVPSLEIPATTYRKVTPRPKPR
jgi:hypothetical protein